MAKRATAHRSTRRHIGKHRDKERPAVLAWLGAGAITLGVGAAMASGTGVANAETESSSAGAKTSSESSGSADSSSTRNFVKPRRDKSADSDREASASDTGSTERGASDDDSDPADQNANKRALEAAEKDADKHTVAVSVGADDADPIKAPEQPDPDVEDPNALVLLSLPVPPREPAKSDSRSIAITDEVALAAESTLGQASDEVRSVSVTPPTVHADGNGVSTVAVVTSPLTGTAPLGLAAATSTSSIIATVPAGDGPGGVVASPDGTRVYVVNSTDRTVSVIDTATNTVTATISALSNNPIALAVSPDGSRVYVVGTNELLSVIDTATNNVVGSTRILRGGEYVGVSPDGTRVYVTSHWGGSLRTIDTATHNVVGSFNLGEGAQGLAISPDGSRVYAGKLHGPVVVINAASNTNVGSPIPVDGNALALAVSRDGTRLYVATTLDKLGYSVLVVDTATNTFIGSPVPIGASHISDLALSPDGTRLYVANRDEGVRVIDTATHAVVGDFVYEGYSEGVALSPDGTRLYVTNWVNNTVAVIDTGLAEFNDYQPWINAVDDHATTAENASVSGNVLDNDFERLTPWEIVDLIGVGTVTLVTGPINGSLSLNSDGTYTYTPDNGFVGDDSFEYSVSFDSLSGTGTVHITVKPSSPPEPSTAEKIEEIWEGFTFWAGFIPGIGTIVNAISLAIDVTQAINAWIRRDADDFTEEMGDIVNDVIGLVPLGRQMTKVNKAFGEAVKNVGGVIADWIIDKWWESNARASFANSGAESCLKLDGGDPCLYT